MSNESNKGGYFAFSEPCFVHNSADPAYADVERDPIPAADLQRMEDGVAKEAKVAAEWAAALKVTALPSDIVALARKGSFATAVTAVTKRLRGRKAVWVPECDRTPASKKSREVITMAAMAAGVPFIWNARLPAADRRISEPDFLIRAETRRPDGKYGYRPGDVKDARALEGDAKATNHPVTTLNAPGYENATRKLLGNGKPKKSHSMQLAHYHLHLDSLGFAAPGNVWGAILGREDVLIWRNLSERNIKGPDGTKINVLEHYAEEFNFRIGVENAAADPASEPLAGPELKSACTSCEFRTVCHDELLDADHISLIPGITPTRAKVHYEAGVVTRSDLARFDWRTAKVLAAGVNVSEGLATGATMAPTAPVSDLIGARKTNALATLSELGIHTVSDFLGLHQGTADTYAGLHPKRLPEEIDAARVAKIGKVHLKRGISDFRVPRADIEIDIDFENAAGGTTGGVIYLWGTRLTVRNKALSIPGEAYRPFVTWADNDDDDEARVFIEFWKWLQTLITLAANSKMSFAGYCYSEAEARCMRHLARKHAGRPGMPTIEDVDALIDSDNWVDMYPLVNRNLLWPTESMSVKAVAKWARHSWRDEDASGDSSTVWYRDAVLHPDEAVRAANQQRLLDYNEDDCVATLVLRDWLDKLVNAREPSRRIPSVSSLNARFVRGNPRRRTVPQRQTPR